MKNKLHRYLGWLVLACLPLICHGQETYFDPVLGANVTLIKSTPIKKIEVFYDQKKWDESQRLEGRIYGAKDSLLPLGNLTIRIRTHQNTFLWEKDFEITSPIQSIELNEDLSSIGYYESGAWIETIVFNDKNRLTAKGLSWLNFKVPTTEFIDIGQDSQAEVKDGKIKIAMDLIGAQNQRNVTVKTKVFRNNTIPRSLISENESVINLNKNAFVHEVDIPTPKEKGEVLIQTQLLDQNGEPISSKKEWHLFVEGEFFELKYLTAKPVNLDDNTYQLEFLGLSNEKKLDISLVFEDENRTALMLNPNKQRHVWNLNETITFPPGIYNARYRVTSNGKELLNAPLNLSKYRPTEKIIKSTDPKMMPETDVDFTKFAILGSLVIFMLILIGSVWRVYRKRTSLFLLALCCLPATSFATLENQWIYPPQAENWSFTDDEDSDFRHIPISGIMQDTDTMTNPFAGGRIVDMATRFVHIDTGETRTHYLSSNVHTDVSGLSWTRSVITQLLGFLFGWGGSTYGEYFYVLDLDKVATTESEENIQGTMAEGEWEIQAFFEIRPCFFFCLFTYGTPTWYATDTIDGDSEFVLDRTAPTLTAELKNSSNQTLSSNDYTNQPITVQIDCQDLSDCSNNQGVFQAVVKGNFCDDPTRCNNDSDATRSYEVCDNIGNCDSLSVDIENYDVTPPNTEAFTLGNGTFFNQILRATDLYNYQINYNEIDTVEIDNSSGVNGQTETMTQSTYDSLFDDNACGDGPLSHFTHDDDENLCVLDFTPCVESSSYFTARGVMDENQNCIASCPDGYLFHWFFQQCYQP